MTSSRRTLTRSITVLILVLNLTVASAVPARAGLLDALLSPVTSLLGAVTDLLLGKASDDVVQEASGPADAQVGIVVQTYQAPTYSDLNQLQSLGGTLTATHTSINGYSAIIAAGSLVQLASNSNIERISGDLPVKAHLDVAYPAIRGNRAAALSGWW